LCAPANDSCWSVIITQIQAIHNLGMGYGEMLIVTINQLLRKQLCVVQQGKVDVTALVIIISYQLPSLRSPILLLYDVISGRHIII